MYLIIAFFLFNSNNPSLTLAKHLYTWPSEALKLATSWLKINRSLSAHVKSLSGDAFFGIDLISESASDDYYGYIKRMVSLKLSEVLVKTRMATYETRLEESVLDEEYERAWMEQMPRFITMQKLMIEETVIGGM